MKLFLIDVLSMHGELLRRGWYSGVNEDMAVNVAERNVADLHNCTIGTLPTRVIATINNHRDLEIVVSSLEPWSK
jgi:hypothetical protein